MTTPNASTATSAEPDVDPGARAFVLPQFGIFAQGTLAHHFLEFDLTPGVSPRRGRGVPAARHARRLGGRRQPGGRVRRRRVALGRAGAGARRPRGVPAGDRPRRAHRAGDPARRVAVDQRRRAGRDVAERARPRPRRSPRRARRGGADGVHLPRRPRHHGLRRRHGEPAGSPRGRRRARPAGRPGAGGSHVLAMRWVHDLDAFEQLPVDEQERVIGRTKADSVELSAAESRRRAHRARRDRASTAESSRSSGAACPFGTVAGLRAVLRRVQRRARRATTGCSRGCLARRRRRTRPPHGLLASGERGVLLRAVADRPRRARPRPRSPLAARRAGHGNARLVPGDRPLGRGSHGRGGSPSRSGDLAAPRSSACRLRPAASRPP